MAKPFIRIGYKSAANSKGLAGTLDYIAREGEYSERNDAVMTGEMNVPAIFRESGGNREFFEEYRRLGRKRERWAMTLTFDLPRKRDGTDWDAGAKGLYEDVVNGIVSRINDNWAIEDGEIRRASEIKGKGEPARLPVSYAVHVLEKERPGEGGTPSSHPHCHMVISTLGFDKRTLEDPNLTPEELIRKGKKAPFTKLPFYYAVTQYHVEAMNEALDRLPENLRGEVAQRFNGMGARKILASERRDFEMLARAFSETKDAGMSYREHLAASRLMSQNVTTYTKIEEELRKLNESSSRLSRFIEIKSSDAGMLKAIHARNRLWERVSGERPAPFAFDTHVAPKMAGRKAVPLDVTGYHISIGTEDGCPVSDAPVRKVRAEGRRYYDMGTMVSVNSEIARAASGPMRADTARLLRRKAQELCTRYLDAVNIFNGYDSEYIKENRRTGLAGFMRGSAPFDEPSDLTVKRDTGREQRALERSLEKVAELDLMIYSALETLSPAESMVKRWFETGELSGELTLPDIQSTIDGHPVEYEHAGGTFVVTSREARKMKAELEKALETAKSDLRKGTGEISEIKARIEMSRKGIKSIGEALENFENITAPRLRAELEHRQRGIRVPATASGLERARRELERYRGDVESVKDGNIVNALSVAHSRIEAEFSARMQR